MTQPAGRIAVGITAEHSFYLRASPFVCVFEAFVLVCQFVCITIRTSSPRMALKRISRAKYHLPTGTGRTQLQELQNNDVFRAILFLAGVLPQAIKLFACKGLPASQTWAMLYLISWAALELLVVMPARYGAVDDPQHPSAEPRPLSTDPLVDFISFIAVHYCDFMALHYMRLRAKAEQQIHNPPISWWDHMANFSMMSFYVLLLCTRITSDGAAAFETFIYCLYTVELFTFSTAERVWLFALRFGRYVAVIGADRTIKDDDPDLPSLKRYSRVGSVAFFLMHVLTAVGAYAFLYDPAGTGRPAWTEYLG
ncbi:MAG: hypothetical protein Q9168_008003 [Polycauliona sp. 1 TL-2023]